MALTLVTLGSACRSDSREPSAQYGAALERYGLSLSVPAGWDAEITRGTVRFGNRELPGFPGPWQLAPGDLVVEVLERDTPAEFPAADAVPQLAADDFAAPEARTYPGRWGLARASFTLAGRWFTLLAESGSRPVAPGDLAQANAILATLSARPGDPYSGQVEPARFEPADGWHTGSSGPRPEGAEGDWTTTWAATIPYRDSWNAFPQRTLESLPRDGVLVWVSLSRFAEPTGRRAGFPVRPRRYRLDDFDVLPGWEGQVRDLPEYRLWTRVDGQYDVDLRVYFGRPRPTRETLARAQEELDRLDLPEWGAWELEQEVGSLRAH
jgi:hypothetical protein